MTAQELKDLYLAGEIDRLEYIELISNLKKGAKND